MKIIITAFSGILIFLNACVSKKLYTDLQGKYDALRDEKKEILSRKDELLKTLAKSKNENEILQKSYDSVSRNLLDLKQEIIVLKKSYENLKNSYHLLNSKSTSALAKNAKENRELIAQLANKQTQFLKENTRLKKIKKELEASIQQIKKLKQTIAQKEKAMKILKNAISEALKSFEGKGLEVIQKNGKVYVSMENKLLFGAGSWSVGEQGKIAVKKIAKILVSNPKIKILIEGHTDSDPYNSNKIIEDNWDLSVKRATAIVRILVKEKVAPKQITAAGRSFYMPVASNITPYGKSKNRRIEIILSPNLDKINQLLNAN